jgi:hypothetical protein
VGSISKEPRGLNDKNRTYMELLLDGVDCGLIPKKLRVSLAKLPGQTGNY